DYDHVSGLVVDHNDNVIICGSTRSDELNTINAHQPEKGGNYSDFDSFIAKFDSSGQIIWNTYYGGLQRDSGINVNIDTSNNVFMVGGTSSFNNISTSGSFQETQATTDYSTDSFIVKFTPE